MPKTDAFADKEVAAFLDHLPRHLTFTEMAAVCLERFGVERTWSRAKILRYWDAFHPVRKGRSRRVDLDGELRAFLDDALGRLTLDRLVAACVARFGKERAPSRSAIHRYSQMSRRSRVASGK